MSQTLSRCWYFLPLLAVLLFPYSVSALSETPPVINQVFEVSSDATSATFYIATDFIDQNNDRVLSTVMLQSQYANQNSFSDVKTYKHDAAGNSDLGDVTLQLPSPRPELVEFRICEVENGNVSTNCSAPSAANISPAPVVEEPPEPIVNNEPRFGQKVGFILAIVIYGSLVPVMYKVYSKRSRR